MSYLEKQLIKNVLDEKSRISMPVIEDSYPLILFSWETFVKIFRNNRFDAIFYYLTFVYLIRAIRSLDLNRNDRLKLLESKYFISFKKCMKFHQRQFFTPKYGKYSLVPLFSQEI